MSLIGSIASRERWTPPLNDAADRRLAVLAAALSGLVAAVALRFSTFVPWGTDAAAYIEAGYRWAEGQLFEPTSLRFWAAWAAGEVESPLGNRPGPIDGTSVSMYPLGYPLLLAAALTFGWLGPYLVAPLSAGVLAWCTFLLGRLGGGSRGEEDSP